MKYEVGPVLAPSFLPAPDNCGRATVLPSLTARIDGVEMDFCSVRTRGDSHLLSSPLSLDDDDDAPPTTAADAPPTTAAAFGTPIGTPTPRFGTPTPRLATPPVLDAAAAICFVQREAFFICFLGFFFWIFFFFFVLLFGDARAAWRPSPNGKGGASSRVFLFLLFSFSLFSFFIAKKKSNKKKRTRQTQKRIGSFRDLMALVSEKLSTLKKKKNSRLEENLFFSFLFFFFFCSSINRWPIDKTIHR